MFRVSSSVAAAASGALCLGLMAGLPAAVAEEPVVEPVESSSLEEALAQARADGEPVEDEEQRTESTSVFANPDGTLTHRDFGGPVRIERGGEWVDVDYTLIERPDGSYAPKAAPVDVSVNAGPADEAARVTFADGQAMAVTWPTDLPEPTIDGGVATYELSAATDLIVAITSEGLNAHLRLNEQPAADDPVFTFGLRTKGVDLEQGDDGSLDVLDADGEVLGGTRTLVAWDAETDAAGEPVNIVPLEADLTEDATHGAVTDNTLELTTPEGFLSDPDTQYPVTIDPDIKVTASPRDIWVRSGVTEGQGSDSTLRVGKIYNHSNTNPARSYVWFSTPSALASRDVQILSAELNLWQYYGFTCSNKRMDVHPTKDAWSGNITWPNRPTSHLQDKYYSWISTNRGTSGCAPNWSKVNVSKIGKAWWETREINNHGFTLLAYNESHHDHERRFCSKEADSSHSHCNTATRRPYLDVTYTEPIELDPASDLRVSVATDPVTVSAKLEHPSGDRVRARFVIRDKNGGPVTTVLSGYVASGSRVSVQLPRLADGTYVVSAVTNDGVKDAPMESEPVRVDVNVPWLTDAEEAALRQEMARLGVDQNQIDRAVRSNAYFASIGTTTAVAVAAPAGIAEGEVVTPEEVLALVGETPESLLASGEPFDVSQSVPLDALPDLQSPDDDSYDPNLDEEAEPSAGAVEDPDDAGSPDFEEAPRVTASGVKQPTASQAKIKYAWRDYQGWYVPVRQGTWDWNKRKGWGWAKISSYHGVNSRMLRHAVKKNGRLTSYWERDDRNFVYRYETFQVKCDGFGRWRTCYVVNKMWTRVLSDRVYANIVKWDGYWRGVFNAYCEQRSGAKRCPEWVRNADM